MSKYGKPGPVYIEIPGDVMKSKVESITSFPKPVAEAPKIFPDQQSIKDAALAIQNSKKPLVIGLEFSNFFNLILSSFLSWCK